MIRIILAIIVAFGCTAGIMPFLIPFLRKLKFGQQILKDGPKWHQAKQGTPTMGGIGFIISIVIVSLILRAGGRAFAVLGFAFVCGVIGFADDYIKVCLKRNMGFNAKQKMLCLIIASVGFVICCVVSGFVDTSILIPFSEGELELSYAYYPIIILVLLGGINSVNLTDGVDGLAGTVTSVVLLFFTVAAHVMGYKNLAVLSACGLGGILGFLIFNLNPAKVFMGDTGSLFLGGFVSALAVIMENPLILLTVGFVYVAEALSVILQVASFQLTGKRIFKMSPLHHHFEMCGWNENKIVAVFSSVTAVLCLVTWFGI